MQSFETSFNQIQKILENIRGYLWKKWYSKKTWAYRAKDGEWKFLERSKKSKKHFKRKKIVQLFNFFK